MGQYKIGRIAQDRRPHMTNTVVGDPRVHDQAWAKREEMVAFAGYPLIVEERLVGVMGLFARQPLTDVVLQAMEAKTQSLALGIERKRAEAALQRTQFSLDHAAVATFWMGADARFVYVNEAASQALGYTRNELLGMAVHDIDPDFSHERWAAHWEEIRHGRVLTIESRHRTKAGRVFPVEIIL